MTVDLATLTGPELADMLEAEYGPGSPLAPLHFELLRRLRADERVAMRTIERERDALRTRVAELERDLTDALYRPVAMIRLDATPDESDHLRTSLTRWRDWADGFDCVPSYVTDDEGKMRAIGDAFAKWSTEISRLSRELMLARDDAANDVPIADWVDMSSARPIGKVPNPRPVTDDEMAQATEEGRALREKLDRSTRGMESPYAPAAEVSRVQNECQCAGCMRGRKILVERLAVERDAALSELAQANVDAATMLSAMDAIDCDRAARNIAYALGLVAAIELGVRVEWLSNAHGDAPGEVGESKLRLAGLWREPRYASTSRATFYMRASSRAPRCRGQ